MALANRPKRTRKATEKALAAKTCGVQKRCSPRLQRAKAVRYAIDVEDFECQTSPTSVLPEVQKRRRHLIDDSASDSESEDDPEPEEQDALSGDHIEYSSGDQFDRRESYDSRLESGNEEYELDDFVVDDDEDDGIPDVSSEITVTSETFIEERRLFLASLVESSQWDVEVRVRKVSLTSSSSVSGLFVSDLKDQPECVNAFHLSESILQPDMGDISPSDVAEEITDAICRFFRRCNRNSAPLHLVLASEMLEDREVVDSLQSAIKQELGRVEAARNNNNVLVVVGPVT
ncbi:hypothetical protein BKA63DRAFT_566814 [Paraphoma chrysanthemicola]|nr:hypothetical protein BKA63DRAFT_566814 [Paraphoma chrysanthemicola]